MLEKYLSRILTSKFENVVEDFDEKAVNVSAWKGEVSLQNLILKRTAFDAFNDNVPVDIVYGKIGKLELRIPWSSLGTKSSSIILTDVSLVIAPRQAVESSDSEQRRKEQTKKTASKEERIQALLNPRILQHSIAASHKRNRLARFLSWVSSSLFSNLSVTIRNIHVRYEDSGSSLGFVWSNHVSPSAFAIGLTLQQFSVQTTNIADQENDNDRLAKNYKVTRKLAAAHKLAVYWDHEAPLIAVMVRQETDRTVARQHASVALLLIENQGDHAPSRSMEQYRRNHSYILLPISPSLQFNLVVAGASADKSRLPPSTVILSLPPCHLEVSRTVLENVAYLRKSFAYWKQSKITEELHETLEQLKRIRPSVSMLENARLWWRYAIAATIILGRSNGHRGRRRGWSALAHAILDRQQYVALYRLFQTDSDIDMAHNSLCKMEGKLEVEEIASFRLAAYEAMVDVPLPDPKTESKSSDADEIVLEIASGTLSSKGRRSMMIDAIRILKEGRNVTSKDQCVSEEPIAGDQEASLQWKTSLFCPEMSFQVNARNSSNSLKPIARLSFACVQRQYLRHDGSWEVDATVAGVKLIDMGVRGAVYPTLIGSKPSLDLNAEENYDDFVVVSGQRFRRCVQVQVQRTFTRFQDCIGSSTHSILRLQPLEVVFSANAVERLTALFSPIRTPELAGDYERMSSVVSKWRETQRQRLLQALAHRRKQITVDLDIAAPVIMIPEEMNRGDAAGEMLVVDLGRVQLRNIKHDDSFDDVWKLVISDMQVQNSRYLSQSDLSKRSLKQQIIEPFSLEFKISTSIVLRQKNAHASNSTSVLIDASLPRIVFNLKTSSIRLISRLQMQRALVKRPLTRPSMSAHQNSSFRSGIRPTVTRSIKRVEEGSTHRLRPSSHFEFLFSAPIIAIKLENDVDGRSFEMVPSVSTPLVNLAFRGIGGTFDKKVNTDGSATTKFMAKMKALEAVDLYQQAGPSFALLLSSVRPSAMPNVALHTLAELPEELVHPHIKTDLVSLTYEMQSSPSGNQSEQRIGKTSSVSIKFHQLFVEWNPETLAAIHKAIRAAPLEGISCSAAIPPREGAEQISECDSDDEFFDTFEDGVESFCSASEMKDDHSSVLISEISSSQSSPIPDVGIVEDRFLNSPTDQTSALSPIWSGGSPTMLRMKPTLQTVLAQQLSPTRHAVAHIEENLDLSVEAPLHQPFELSFDLSTLQVSFNKETRHRRLIIAEMDSTSIRYSTRQEGGSKTVARIGNLVFTDPSFSDGTTLYNQILGLKSDGTSSNKAESSLLELTFIANNAERSFVPGLPSRLFLETQASTEQEYHEDGVSINTDTGEIRGCNFYVNIVFSPMRFVYLQQLWFEIIDYFFEGIAGYEVWGNARPTLEPSMEVFDASDPRDCQSNERRKPNLPGSKAEGINFTCFKVSLASPEVLLPIKYNSPHFIRFTCESLDVSNFYSNRVNQVSNTDVASGERVQWYNNCSMHFRHIKFQSWNGTDLTLRRDGIIQNPDIRIQMIWPSGPSRQMVAPKWTVRCDLDEIDLSLRCEDYALFQHVILHNIGEPSRHLDEWIRFQAMSFAELEAYKAKIMVHYGYDKKDTEPSTFDVEISAPLLLFNLLGETPHKRVIAQAMCLNLSWKMQRLRDLVSRQQLVSNVVLVKPSGEGDKKHALPLLLPTKRGTARDGRPDVVYTSTTNPTGENVKTLEVIDAGINLTFPAWMDALSFFSNLDEPKVMTKFEVQNSVQIGDRWYSMSSQKEKGAIPDEASKDGAGRAASPKSPTISQTSQFRLLLESPRIVLESENDGNSVILHMDRIDSLHVNDAATQSSTRTIFIHDLELYTVTSSGAHRDSYSVENSLISPWSFLGRIQTLNREGMPDYTSQSIQVAAEVFKARAAYSDMIVALKVARQLMKDIGMHQDQQKSTAKTQARTSSVDKPPINARDSPKVSRQCSIHVDGFQILVVDDSMRHFANSQELVSFSLGQIVFLREDFHDARLLKFKCGITYPNATSCPGTLLVLRVSNMDLVDYLQAPGSRFRVAATTRANDSGFPSQSINADRLFELHLYSTTGSSSSGYEPSPNLIRMLQSRCSVLSAHEGGWPLAYENLLFNGVSRNLKVEAQSFAMQWNPSTVIALQRFLGRLSKEMYSKPNAEEMVEKPRYVNQDSRDVQEADRNLLPDGLDLPMQVVFSMKSLSVCLNKEHQNRRLLKAILSDIRVAMSIDAHANSTFIGGVHDVQACDEDTYASLCILQENRSVLRVMRNSDGRSGINEFPFLTFQYSTYSNGRAARVDDLPTWIVAKLEDSSGQGIDDYLSISIASVELTYIRGRAEELADFLTNGLPGKGMGLTSSAAKGFINKRIQTRSFLNLDIAAPILRIPEHEESANGVTLHLGDMQLRTWFELGDGQEGQANQHWCRALSVSVLGLGWKTYCDRSSKADEDLPIDLYFDLRKPMHTNNAKTMTLQGRLSFVVMRLRYSDYRLLRDILAHNIGKKADVSKWDNVEKAYWIETSEERESSEKNDVSSIDQRVAYSSSARFVRYGPKERPDRENFSEPDALPARKEDKTVDFEFKMDGVHLTLHRDDDIDADIASDGQFSAEFNYDVVLLRLETVEVSFSLTSDGDSSLNVTLSRIGLYDLGDFGRLAREHYFLKLAALETSDGKKPFRSSLRNPSAFTIIAEGYPSVDADAAAHTICQVDPQLVVTVDTCPSAAVGTIGSTEFEIERMTIVRMVINYLSINAMIRPLREVTSFATCSWSRKSGTSTPGVSESSNELVGKENESRKYKASSFCFQVKLVAHYPRIFFVADESDSRSRALVLRGLAVVNASIFQESSRPVASSNTEITRKLSLDANLQSMESFINPDVSVALGSKPEGMSPKASSDISSLGVALIQPVTAGIEFQQISKERFPTIRSLNLNMESVSTMLSFEDLGLINQVVKRWFPEGRSPQSPQYVEFDSPELKVTKFEEVFRTSRLGLMLRKSFDGVVVDRIESTSGQIKVGDRLVAINENDVAEYSLHDVVQLLSKTPRPMKVRFIRTPTANSIEDAKVKGGVKLPRDQDAGERVSRLPSDGKAPRWYQMHFKMGMSTGIVIQRSHVGDIPIISSVNVSELSRAIVGVEEVTPAGFSPLRPPDLTRVPLTGTAVISVSGLKSVDIGFDEMSRVLEEFEKSSGSSDSYSHSDLSAYPISFVELTSEEWGSIDTFDACVAGVALTFIDDFQGRDMPLLRGKADSIELHCDRGIGLQTDKIDTATASVFGTIANAVEVATSEALLDDASAAIRNILNERVIKVSGSYQSEMDYYHPRIAVWEPLLEPSQLAMNLVWKPGTCAGSQKRPGQLAFEISDRLDTVKRQTRPGQLMATNAVSLNVTDAAAEVVARTLRQFSKWKENLALAQPLEDEYHKSLSPENRNSATFGSTSGGHSNDALPEENESNLVPSVKRAAAREAAQAALVFAQKRGVNTQMKGDSAKPFLFRNKTGVDLRFCVLDNATTDYSDDAQRLSLASGCESRFQMEIVARDHEKAAAVESEISTSKKVRSYNGRFPPLAVWIEASEGFNIEPLLDLQVSRVGTFVRELKVMSSEADGHEGTVVLPLIWRVELDDNRRILTLSSAVQISSLAFGLSLDLGFTRSDSKTRESPVKLLCSISPGESFFLPLWMSLGLEERHIYVRPSNPFSEHDFGWGHVSILAYECKDIHSPHWMFREPAASISCSTPQTPHYKVDAIWLSCLNAPFAIDSLKGSYAKGSSERRRDGSRNVLGVVHVAVDACITLRNMLPIPLCWEIADTMANVIDGSLVRSEPAGKKHLEPGSRAEVFACDITNNDLFLRLKPVPDMEWTERTYISMPKVIMNMCNDKGMSIDPPVPRIDVAFVPHIATESSQKRSVEPLPQQLSVHTVDDFGVPVRFGIRVNPKFHQPSRGRHRCYGLELVFFAELWFQNLTDLPLCFGSPWSQLQSQNTVDASADDASTFESASKAAAESALLEIASVLEFGEKGKGLRAEQATSGGSNIYNIPLQASNELIQEVFEYMEVNRSVVTRSWWAAEQYDSPRRDIANFPERGSSWKWLDERWLLDCSGQVSGKDGAWESCRSLTAGRDSYFSGQRTFDDGHLFRRRRWFRRYCCASEPLGLLSGIRAFHHPVGDPTLADGTQNNKQEDGRLRRDAMHCFSLRNDGGEWSNTVQLPQTGSADGVMRVLSSRWPTVTRTACFRSTAGMDGDTSLKPELFEVCYNVSDLTGEWGEFSRLVTITPRFHVRNDSSSMIFQVKQAGVLDTEAILVYPGEVVPFFWQDFRLPALVCVRPLPSTTSEYRWSGGFDICTLGSVPLRIRPKSFGDEAIIFSVKALVEIRPNSSGVNISLKDEDTGGVGAMFRVENDSPFPIWIAQDGVLANPSLEHNAVKRQHSRLHNLSDRPPEIDGDVVLPRSRRAFALDVPFRQGKYASRKAATMKELLRVRVGLAPLSTRSGVETTKVISFTSVGDGVRLNPTKMHLISSFNDRMYDIRVLGLVVTDGPTRVLQFELMRKEFTSSQAIGNALAKQSGYKSPTGFLTGGSVQDFSEGQEILRQIATKAALEAIELGDSGKLLKEDDVRREAFLSQRELELDSADLEKDIVFSFTGHFTGFLFSLIDAAPAEVAAITIKGVEAAAKWNMKRSGDATALVSVAWIQIDNHVPNAPYPVAVCPDQSDKGEFHGKQDRTPLLMMTFKFAPKHKSGILCLRQVTLAPSNLAVAIDLAFIVRLQGLFLGIRDHFVRDENPSNLAGLEYISYPDIARNVSAGTPGSDSLKLYFENLVILPSNVNLSVAPARGLTSAQAQLEGTQAAAIHAAVRKGDIRFADGGVGVALGRKNRTAMAVVRGVFKSILVDALLRLDGASVYFAGVSLNNHESSGSQLKAYLVAHYLASLRENMPSLLGSLSAFGNPLGLIRGIGDGVTDFVSEPVKGLKRSVEELDPAFVVDGVARGTESLARHTVGGIADSASMLTETFSKNMAVLTLDRRYAQRRDMARSNQHDNLNFVEGLESGVAQLVRGVIEGVTGVVKAPIRGAEKNGFEGFAKGIGKGLLGLLVKPMIGLSDAATDVMIGVRGSVDAGRQSGRGTYKMPQLRPRRTMYGTDRILRVYSLADAAASTLMLRTNLAGENYLSHVDMGDRVLLVSDKKFVLLGPDGQELLLVKFKNVRSVELHQMEDGTDSEWGVFITLSGRGKKDVAHVEVLRCGDNHSVATSLTEQLQRGLDLVSSS